MKGIRAGAAAGALLCAVVAQALLLGQAPAQTVGPPPPNFIVVMSDDQGPGMMRALPTVSRELGAGGTTFTNAFASYPLCCPARATLLTGEYAHNHGTKGNNPLSGGGYRALLSPERTLASWLQANGYETAFVGKWLNGLRTPRRAPPGWDQWHGLVGAGGEGLSSFYDYDVFEPDGSARHFGDRPADYQTDALTREYALPFIDAQAAVPGPFFLWLAYHPPHNGVGRDDPAGERCSEGPPASRKGKHSAIPPPRYARSYAAARVPQPPSFDERDVDDKPKFVRRRPPLTREDLTQIDRDYRCGLAALRALDDSVRRIVDHLGSTAQLENTVLVFLTDQGVMAGEHRIKRGKNRPYEEAIRIPLLIRGPGIAAGSEVDAPVVQRRPGADDPRARRRRDPARARTPDRRAVAGHVACHRTSRPRAGWCRSRAVATSPPPGAGSRFAPTSACAPPATPTSSTGGPASAAAPRGSTPRSAPGGRPNASSTTSPGTPTSFATATPIPPTRRREAGSRTSPPSSSAARGPSASSTPRSPARGAAVSLRAATMGGKARSTRARAAVVAALALLAAVGSLLAGGSGAPAAVGRPNIVLITTDDQTLASLAVMKRVRRLLVDRGATFTQNIASFPLCCPSRASWITGEYAHNHGVIDNHERDGGGYQALRDPDRVLPVWLDQAGYDTALVGKWLHDYSTLRPAPGWDRFWALTAPTMVNYYGYEVTDSHGGRTRYGKRAPDYVTDALTRDYALPYIRDHATDRDPFFLHLSYIAPHWGRGRNDAAGRRCANGKPFKFETAKAKPAPRDAGAFGER